MHTFSVGNYNPLLSALVSKKDCLIIVYCLCYFMFNVAGSCLPNNQNSISKWILNRKLFFTFFPNGNSRIRKRQIRNENETTARHAISIFNHSVSWMQWLKKKLFKVNGCMYDRCVCVCLWGVCLWMNEFKCPPKILWRFIGLCITMHSHGNPENRIEEITTTN